MWLCNSELRLQMSSTLPTTTSLLGAEDESHLQAARALIEEVQTDYLRLIVEREALEGVITKWRELMKRFRAFESAHILQRKPPPERFQLHRDIMSLMIFCAGSIATAGERHLAGDYRSQPAERQQLAEMVETVKLHQKFLEFEFSHVHGLAPTKEQAEELERVLGDGSRNAS
jgi:hypothetical protein